MDGLKNDMLDTDACAGEKVMAEWVFDKAKAFYKNPENLKAFEAWKQNKEEQTYGTNHIDS